MAETKHILILANSERVGGRCIAGKIATPIDDKHFDVSQQWIRLNYPLSTTGGAVPYQHTLRRPPHRTAVRPFDFIKVSLLEQCNNLDHPEDWNYDHNVPWEYVGTANHDSLPPVADTPRTIWHDGDNKSVHAGYIRKMPKPASLYLIKAPKGWSFEYFKEWDRTKGYEKKSADSKCSLAAITMILP